MIRTWKETPKLLLGTFPAEGNPPEARRASGSGGVVSIRATKREYYVLCPRRLLLCAGWPRRGVMMSERTTLVFWI